MSVILTWATQLEDSSPNSMQAAMAATIRRIPRGRVSTYGAVAAAAGYPRCSRHVARVLTKVRGLPWQRVVGSGGRISLCGEEAMEQRFLLESEGVRFRGRRVDLKQFEFLFVGKARRSVPVSSPGREMRRK